MCGDEYRPGFARCGDCDAILVEEPVQQPPPAPDLVTVLETGSQSLLAVAKSILDSAGVPYVARNERLQDLFGWGRLGTGFNLAMGPVRLEVPRDRLEEARVLLTQRPYLSGEDG